MINKEIMRNRLSSVRSAMAKNRFNGVQVMKQCRIILGAWLALPGWMNTDFLLILPPSLEDQRLYDEIWERFSTAP